MTYFFVFLLSLPVTVTVIFAVPGILAVIFPLLLTVATFVLPDLNVTPFIAEAGVTVTFNVFELPSVIVYFLFVTVSEPIFSLTFFTDFSDEASAWTEGIASEASTMTAAMANAAIFFNIIFFILLFLLVS